MKSEIRNRIYYLDFVRIVACIMVIIQHAPKPDIGINSVLLSAVSFLTYPCIGLFFMVSGALLLPVRQTTNEFYKRRLIKVAVPAIIWMVVYLLLGFCLGNYSVSNLLKYILLIPLTPSTVPVFWFIYVLIGLYLFAPIISPWLLKSTKKDIKCYLILWGITLFIPVLNSFFNIPYGYYSILCYFGGYLGYFILGYYLHHYSQKITLLSILCFIGMPIIAYALCKYLNMKSDFNTYYYLSIYTAPMVIGWFLLIKRITPNNLHLKMRSLVTNMSNACFGIYLVHVLIMRYLLWEIDILTSYGGLFQIISTSLLTVIISFTITHLLSKIPYSKFFIGY